MTKHFVVRCNRCTGADVVTNTLNPNYLCPVCNRSPASYESNGEHFCWLHGNRMIHQYPVPHDYLMTEYFWRGNADRFPNAKLFESKLSHESEKAFDAYFCDQCQTALDSWLHEN